MNLNPATPEGSDESEEDERLPIQDDDPLAKTTGSMAPLEERFKIQQVDEESEYSDDSQGVKRKKHDHTNSTN